MPQTDAELLAKIKAKISPVTIHTNLLVASAFLMAYELLHLTIVQEVEDFCCSASSPEEIKEHRKEMRRLNKDKLVASCLWLKNMAAIVDDDIQVISRIRDHRNTIAHELPKMIIDYEHEIDLELLSQLIILQRKVDMWWFTEVEMSINPDLCDEDVSEVKTGRMMLMDLVLQTLFGKTIEDYQVQRGRVAK